MSLEGTNHDRLFLFVDMLPQSRHFAVGEYVCGYFPHITVGTVQTKRTDEVLEIIQMVSSATAPFEVQRGDLMIVGNRRKKIASKIIDFGEFQRYQHQMFDAIAHVPDTVIGRRTAYTHLRGPHISHSYPESAAFDIPSKFIITNLTSALTLNFYDIHHRNKILDIAHLK